MKSLGARSISLRHRGGPRVVKILIELPADCATAVNRAHFAKKTHDEKLMKLLKKISLESYKQIPASEFFFALDRKPPQKT